MKVNFTIEGKAFSINKTYTRDIRFRSSEFKEWYTLTKTSIQEHDAYKSLLELADDFKSKGGTIVMSLQIVYPFWAFRNKQGEISARTLDVTNYEKGLVDLLLQDCLQINDKNLVKLTSSKCEGPTYQVRIEVTHEY